VGAWAQAFNSHRKRRGAEAPRLGSGSVLGASALVEQLTPSPSCDVEAMAEFMTARLVELVSGRLSDGRRVFRMLAQKSLLPFKTHLQACAYKLVHKYSMRS
jgi:hypothetical protein